MVIDPTNKGWVLKRGDCIGRAETVHTGGTNGTDYQLNPVSPNSNWSPFWVVRATPDIINGHNEIFMEPFLRFVGGLVFSHVRYSRSAQAPKAMPRS